MADILNEYDRIHYEVDGEELIAHDNIVLEEALSEDEDRELSAHGFLIRKIDDTNYWVISSRLDEAGLTEGVEAMYNRVRSA